MTSYIISSSITGKILGLFEAQNEAGAYDAMSRDAGYASAAAAAAALGMTVEAARADLHIEAVTVAITHSRGGDETTIKTPMPVRREEDVEARAAQLDVPGSTLSQAIYACGGAHPPRIEVFLGAPLERTATEAPLIVTLRWDGRTTAAERDAIVMATTAVVVERVARMGR